jgi:hypothetical protein
MSKKLKMIGQRFDRLIVVAIAGRNKWNKLLWWCECDCGEYLIVVGDNLKNRDTKSCGCLKRELAGKHVFKHGQSNTKIYKVWANIINRCHNYSHIGFNDYGGRGITICKRWLKFENFIADMGPKPTPKHAINRINNNANYEPNNCEWILPKINNRNKRKYKNNTTGCNGVCWNKINKTYMAQINKIYLGSFKNLPDAIIARKTAEVKYWGETSNA